MLLWLWLVCLSLMWKVLFVDVDDVIATVMCVFVVIYLMYDNDVVFASEVCRL